MKHKEYIDDICTKTEALLDSIAKAEHSGFDFHEYPVEMLLEIGAAKKRLTALQSIFSNWYLTIWDWFAKTNLKTEGKNVAYNGENPTGAENEEAFVKL